MASRMFSAHVLALALFVLAACGGEGGDEPPSLPFDGAGAPAPDDGPDTEGANVPSGYPAGSEERAAFQRLNHERLHCGFGPLQQDTRLDQAARAHTDWMLIHHQFSHSEDPALARGYTGRSVSERARHAGYERDDIGENIAASSGRSKHGRGAQSVRELLAGVYHAIGLLGPMRDVGISVRQPSDVGSTANFVPSTIVTGTQAGVQGMPGDGVVTYPCQGTAGARRTLGNESPNPVPGRNLSTQPLGPAIVVMVREGQTLTLSAASVVRNADDQPVAMRPPVNGDSDPHVNESHVGYVLPDAPLRPNTAYRVTVDGANNGAPFHRVFVFSTGG